jgi:hypothetical protein
MILVENRQIIAERIAQAHRKSARLKAACALAGIDVRTGFGCTIRPTRRAG